MATLWSTLREGTVGGGGGDAVSHEDSLRRKPKGLGECLGDQPPVVLY